MHILYIYRYCVCCMFAYIYIFHKLRNVYCTALHPFSFLGTVSSKNYQAICRWARRHVLESIGCSIWFGLQPTSTAVIFVGFSVGDGWHGLTICGSNQFGETDVDDALVFLFVDDARFRRKPKQPGSLCLVRMCQLMISAVSSPQ